MWHKVIWVSVIIDYSHAISSVYGTPHDVIMLVSGGRPRAPKIVQGRGDEVWQGVRAVPDTLSEYTHVFFTKTYPELCCVMLCGTNGAVAAMDRAYMSLRARKPQTKTTVSARCVYLLLMPVVLLLIR